MQVKGVLRFWFVALLMAVTPMDSSRADEATYAPFSTFQDCDTCPELVVIPPGSFRMGSPYGDASELPVHTVTIDYSFAIGRAEVKVGEWKTCVADGVCESFTSRFYNQIDDFPRSGPGWIQAKNYVRWLSKKTGYTYRLPSEAEWEYAARGGTIFRYWWGPKFKPDYANCCTGGPVYKAVALKPAGAYPTNPFGLYDVTGSLSEWTEDCWNPSFEKAPRDGSPRLTGQCHLRVIKGGDRWSGPEYVRPSYRYGLATDASSNSWGLRVIRELP